MKEESIPNPRRVAAGRINRQKRGPITDAGRKILRQTVRRTKPWLLSTGPKTEDGKAKSAQNAKRPLDLNEEFLKQSQSLASNLARLRVSQYAASTPPTSGTSTSAASRLMQIVTQNNQVRATQRAKELLKAAQLNSTE